MSAALDGSLHSPARECSRHCSFSMCCSPLGSCVLLSTMCFACQHKASLRSPWLVRRRPTFSGLQRAVPVPKSIATDHHASVLQGRRQGTRRGEGQVRMTGWAKAPSHERSTVVTTAKMKSSAVIACRADPEGAGSPGIIPDSSPAPRNNLRGRRVSQGCCGSTILTST